MKNYGISIAAYLFLAVFCFMPGVFGQAIAREGQDKPKSKMPQPRGDDPKMPNGVIGVALKVGAERIGDPARLYVAHVHPEGPAQQAGLKQGEEIATVNGTAVTGQTYEQVVMMVRGEAGTSVKLGVKSEGGIRELSIPRVASETLYKEQKGKMKPHGGSAR